MITWKTHSNIIIARNPQPNGIYGFDLYTLDNRFIGAIIIRTPEEQKEHRYSPTKALSNFLDGWLLRWN